MQIPARLKRGLHGEAVFREIFLVDLAEPETVIEMLRLQPCGCRDRFAPITRLPFQMRSDDTDGIRVVP